MYPDEFKRISVGMYTSNWNNVSDADALADGFVIAYAMSAPDEDFVEMIAMMLVEGKQGFDDLVNSITQPGPNGTTPEQARARLRQKEAIVVKYFAEAWKDHILQPASPHKNSHRRADTVIILLRTTFNR